MPAMGFLCVLWVHQVNKVYRFLQFAMRRGQPAGLRLHVHAECRSRLFMLKKIKEHFIKDNTVLFFCFVFILRNRKTTPNKPITRVAVAQSSR